MEFSPVYNKKSKKNNQSAPTDYFFHSFDSTSSGAITPNGNVMLPPPELPISSLCMTYVMHVDAPCAEGQLHKERPHTMLALIVSLIE